MQEEKFEMFRNRLAKVYRHLSKIARKQQISCYRVYDHDIPEFPICIEIYEQQAYLAEYKRNHGLTDEAHYFWLQKTIDIIANILAIPRENIFTKLRQKKAGRLGQYQKNNTTQHEFIVRENGLQFIVNLEDYLDTGLFLDHRITRKIVMQESKDKNVLNLFAYTGSFSVYAAAGGAAAITTIDLSKTYIAWAARNMALNNFTNQQYEFIQADVLQYLQEAPAEKYDIIIMDPPTFSNSKRMDRILDIQKDHVSLINKSLRLLTPDGQLFFSTNARKFILHTAAIHTTNIKDITKATTPFDFEGKLFRWCYNIKK